MAPNLEKWLLKYKDKGPLVGTPYKFRVGRDRLKEKLAIEEWPNDVLRHTCATQMYARSNDIDKTCAELGHYEKNTFLKHYKGVMPKPADVAKFWKIVPNAVPAKNAHADSAKGLRKQQGGAKISKAEGTPLKSEGGVDAVSASTLS